MTKSSLLPMALPFSILNLSPSELSIPTVQFLTLVKEN
jgi:hypothetical protein